MNNINFKIEVINEGRKAILKTWNARKNEAVDYEWETTKGFDLDQPMTVQFASWWVQNWDLYLKYFSMETLEKCLSEMEVSEFLSLEWIPADSWSLKYSAEKHDIFSRANNKDKGYVKKGGTYIHDISYGYNVYTKDKYDFGGKKLFRKCLIKEYKFLKHYDFASYHLDSYPEIYVHTAFKMTDERRAIGTNSIYVPMDALLYGDSSIIVKRQTEYFSDYYSWKKGRWCSGVTEEEVNSWRDKNIGFLDSVIGKSLLEEVDEFRK